MLKNRGNSLSPPTSSTSSSYSHNKPQNVMMGQGRTHPQAKLKNCLSYRRPFALLAGIVVLIGVANLFGDSGDDFSTQSFFLRGSRSRHIETFAGAYYPGAYYAADAVKSSNEFKFAAIGDLDERARIPGSKKPEFFSPLIPGTLMRKADGTYSVKFDSEPVRLTGKHNEAGRGMELSELVLYNGRLLSFDDRTGTVYEIIHEGGKKIKSVPRIVITEGLGDTDKGMKWEWAAVKDGELILGSFGKEFTDNEGKVVHTNNLWVAVVNKYGEFLRKDWGENYNYIKKSLDVVSPGYIIHEAVRWSDKLHRWVIIPRRISNQPYDDTKDEKRGAHKILMLDGKFRNPVKIEMEASKDLRPGFEGVSSFAFIPGTGDKHALVTRSVEEGCTLDDDSKCHQEAYISVYDITTGKVLMKDVRFPGNYKYEGVEFVDIYASAKSS